MGVKHDTSFDGSLCSNKAYKTCPPFEDAEGIRIIRFHSHTFQVKDSKHVEVGVDEQRPRSSKQLFFCSAQPDSSRGRLFKKDFERLGHEQRASVNPHQLIISVHCGCALRVCAPPEMPLE